MPSVDPCWHMSIQISCLLLKSCFLIIKLESSSSKNFYSSMEYFKKGTHKWAWSYLLPEQKYAPGSWAFEIKESSVPGLEWDSCQLDASAWHSQAVGRCLALSGAWCQFQLHTFPHCHPSSWLPILSLWRKPRAPGWGQPSLLHIFLGAT